MKKTLCITIDLDPLDCYSRLYGLPLRGDEIDPVLVKAPERLARILEPFGARATVFVVGNTLLKDEHAQAISSLSQRGFEIANHTWSHPYALSRMAPAEIDAEVYRGSDAIERVCTKAPIGFRAPGYLLGQNVLDRLVRHGVEYDASVLPSPGYQLIKASAMALLRLSGRTTVAVLGDPRESMAPVVPYRPDARNPWKRGDSILMELPISRLGPFALTGSLLSISGKIGAQLIARLMSGTNFVHLELHGVDLVDLDSDSIDGAFGVQPDLRIAWGKKAFAIKTFISILANTHELRTLRQVSGRLKADGVL